MPAPLHADPSKSGPSSGTPKVSDARQPDADRHRQHHADYAAEASGLLIIAVLLLILILIRYWPYIPWSAR